MDSVASNCPVVNPQVEGAIKSHLRFVTRGLSARSVVNYRQVALRDMTAKGAHSLYWMPPAGAQIDDAVVIATARALLAKEGHHA